MKKKKILVLVPDGVGLRNFAYGDFSKLGARRGFEIVFWNQTPFDLSAVGHREIRIGSTKLHPLTDILKKARREIELSLNVERTGDRVYDSYRFRDKARDVKSAVRIFAVKLLAGIFRSEKGAMALRRKIAKKERSTPFYRSLRETLERETPDLVFSTSQRMATAMAPLYAAMDLRIPTAAFIFSWDNIPKATLDTDASHFLVWSDHMKKELLDYHSHIGPGQVMVTGTPQFEPHKDPARILPRETFLASLGLDPWKRYICYSGDDVTTSPNDPLYLRDVALAVRSLNRKGRDLHIIFRRCPVDFSSRFDKVLDQFKDVVTAADPLWAKFGDTWNMLLPTDEDLTRQMNTIAHTDLVVNLGSSMVFDYASFGKPCAFVRYDYEVKDNVRRGWSVEKTYNFVHFRSMPSPDCVVWFKSASEVESKLEQMLDNPQQTVSKANTWFEKINQHPQEAASGRILDAFETIIEKHG